MQATRILHVLPARYPQEQYAIDYPRPLRFPGAIFICPNAHRQVIVRPLPGTLFARPTMCPFCGLPTHQEGRPQ